MSSRFSFHLLLWSCLLILLGVMGWLSHSMLDAEKRRLAETHQIRLVEQSRLALWRMDSLLASMIAGENNRSPGEYFQGNALAEVRKEEGAMPDLSGFAKLYFQIDPRGNVSSPQKDRERLEYVLQLGRSGWGSRVVDAMKNLPRPASISAGNAVQPETAPPAEEAVQVTSVAIMDGREQQKNGLQQELAVESRKAFQQGMEDYNMRKNLSNSQQEYNVSVKVKKKAMEPPRRAKKEIADSGRLVVSGEVNGMESPEGEGDCLDVAGSLKRTGKKLESGAGDIAALLDMGAAALTLDGKMVQFEVHEQKANPVPVKESLAEMSVTRRDGFAKTPESYREFSISSLQPRWQQGKECFLTRRISGPRPGMGAGNLAGLGQVIRLPAGVRSRYFAGGHPGLPPTAGGKLSDPGRNSRHAESGQSSLHARQFPADGLEFHGDGVVLRASGPVRGHWLHDRPHPPERTPRRIRFRRDA